MPTVQPNPISDRHLAEAPRWLRIVAHVCVLAPLPSGLWRIAMSFHIPVGWHHPIPWYAPLYTIALSAFVESLAFLALGLVRPWGERFPAWLPMIGRQRVPAGAVVAAALSGAVALTWLTVLAVMPADRGFGAPPEPGDPTGVAADVVVGCYAPLALWGPLLAVATYGYWRRTRPHLSHRTPVPVAQGA